MDQKWLWPTCAPLAQQVSLPGKERGTEWNNPIDSANFQYTSLAQLEFLLDLHHDMLASNLELTQTFCLKLIDWIHHMIKLYRNNFLSSPLMGTQLNPIVFPLQFKDLFVPGFLVWQKCMIHVKFLSSFSKWSIKLLWSDPQCLWSLKTSCLGKIAALQVSQRQHLQCNSLDMMVCANSLVPTSAVLYVCASVLHRPVPFPSQGWAKSSSNATCRIYHALNTGILESN